jgi:N-acetylneuraminate synthase
VYTIAEIGNNHQGEVVNAIKLIDYCVSAGFDAVKFQHRDIDFLYGAVDKLSLDIGAQYVCDLVTRFSLNNHDMGLVRQYAQDKKIDFICTPWDISSLDFLLGLDVKALKIASADLSNTPLIQRAAISGKPVILSTGMSNEIDIVRVSNQLNFMRSNFALLHCQSIYPAPAESLELSYMERLNQISGKAVGYSSHDLGFLGCFAAAALGASIIEKHVTLSRDWEGNDHRISLMPEELRDFIEGIRAIELMVSSDYKPRSISQGELINSHALGKSLYYSNSKMAGEEIVHSDIIVTAPGGGVPPNKIDEYVGKKIRLDVKKGDAISPHQITGESPSFDCITQFESKIGIPVRPHDLDKLSDKIQCQLYELHLGVHDLGISPASYLSSWAGKANFTIHAPEIFLNDHLLDLCSQNKSHRDLSIEHFQKVVDYSEEVRAITNIFEGIKLICNVGGWSVDEHKPEGWCDSGYELLADSFSRINFGNVTPLIQTMPPFPWHFGGRRFHNLFLDPRKIKEVCDNYDYKICLDISHTLMYCEWANKNMFDEILRLEDYVSHIHIADALGVDGEGCRLGFGDLDINRFINMINKDFIGSTRIIEVWQGHKDGGSGFVEAFNFLRKAGMK